jgi:AcrR family transcriptional regulator
MTKEIADAAARATQNRLTAVEIASRAGVSDRTVRNAFQNKHKPQPVVSNAIVAAVDFLLSQKLTEVDRQPLEASA